MWRISDMWRTLDFLLYTCLKTKALFSEDVHYFTVDALFNCPGIVS